MTTESMPGVLRPSDVLGPLPEAATPEAYRKYSADQMRTYAAQERAAERERWRRIAENAQAVTTGGDDRIESFRVPSHLMAALALALDEWPNVAMSGPPKAVRSMAQLCGTTTDDRKDGST